MDILRNNKFKDDVIASKLAAQDQLKPICSKCFKIPLILIKKTNAQISCTCGFKADIPIKNYFNELKLISSNSRSHCINHLQEKAFEYCIQCNKWMCSKCIEFHPFFTQNHNILTKQDPDFPFSYSHHKEMDTFCKNCQKYLCLNCKAKHDKNHELINIPDFTSHINIRKFKERIIEGKKYLQEYYSKIKNDYFRIIEEEYQKSLEKNKDILVLYSLFVNNFIPNYINEYNLLLNITKNELHFPKFNEKEKSISLFYQSNFIVKQNEFIVNLTIPFKEILEHSSNVWIVTLLKDKRLVSCSSDKTIKIFDPNQNYKCLFTITEHNNAVYYLSILKDGRLVSSSNNHDIKIWKININTYECLTTINTGHSSYIVNVIPLPNNRIASCSCDKTIKIWKSTSPYECISTLSGHEDSIYSIVLMDNKHLLAASSSEVLLWNIDTYKKEKIINDLEVYYWNGMVKIDDNRAAIAGEKNLKILNISTLKIEVSFQNLANSISSLLLLSNNNLFCGFDNGDIFEYHFMERTLIKKANCHQRAIRCMLFCEDSNELISCSDDNNIKIWR